MERVNNKEEEAEELINDKRVGSWCLRLLKEQ